MAARLALHGAPDRPRFLPLGVSGVYNWRGTIGKTTGPDGSRLDVKGAIPDLDWITWEGRRVVIAHDADAVTKEPVRIARSELAAHLRRRGAIVGFLEWDGYVPGLYKRIRRDARSVRIPDLLESSGLTARASC